ncbi:hypothetical protein [Pseudomonas viridiflava]|uniref:hypothetical protein n=1 Tax=Pseudomonas viridiflava TaxID=33069 RepID=UPI0013CFE52D|nr:hypothetical protein [Pseudomonas viridiflava]
MNIVIQVACFFTTQKNVELANSSCRVEVPHCFQHSLCNSLVPTHLFITVPDLLLNNNDVENRKPQLKGGIFLRVALKQLNTVS